MLFSSYYFGPIPYFQELAKYDSIELDLHEYYKKQTWRNRTEILGSNGNQLLSVPVLRPNGSASIMKEIRITDDTNWRKDHWKAIESSYKHAPYFFYYGPQIKELIYTKIDSLVEYNTFILKTLLNWLDLEIAITFSEQYQAPKNPNDYRVKLDVKKYNLKQKSYIQVFSDKSEFQPNLSIIDLLMNEGPLSRKFLM